MKNKGRKFKLFCAMAAVTFPLMLQSHLSLSPYSVASSLLLLQIALCVRIANAEKAEYGMVMAALFCLPLMTFILPEYILFGAIPLLFCAVKRICRSKTKWKTAILAILLLAVTVTGSTVAQDKMDPGTMPYEQENALFSLYLRTTWQSSLSYVVNSWELFEPIGMSFDEYYSQCENVERMLEVVRPFAKENLTKEEFISVYSQLIRIRLRFRDYRFVKDSAVDGICYGLSPALLLLQLDGHGTSYAARNYENMTAHHPAFSAFLLRYGCWWFCIALLLCTASVLLRHMAHKKENGEKSVSPFTVGLCVTVSAVMMMAYTLRGAEMMDYKCTLLISGLWIIGMTGIMGREDKI